METKKPPAIDLLYVAGILELLAGTYLMWGFNKPGEAIFGLILFHMGIKDCIDPYNWIKEIKEKRNVT